MIAATLITLYTGYEYTNNIFKNENINSESWIKIQFSWLDIAYLKSARKILTPNDSGFSLNKGIDYNERKKFFGFSRREKWFKIKLT